MRTLCDAYYEEDESHECAFSGHISQTLLGEISV